MNQIRTKKSLTKDESVSSVSGMREFYSRADAIAILDLYAELAEPAAAG
jgi:hypothetical protein